MSPRLVYIDAGANWGDTIDGYRMLASAAHRNATGWEVYAFEASPFIMPYLDKLVAWKNALPSDGSMPPPVTCVPPVGSSEDLMHFTLTVEPNGSHCYRRSQKLAYACMQSVFHKVYRSMRRDEALMSSATVSKRLASAAQQPQPSPSRGLLPRYTLIPAAVGASAGILKASQIRTFMFDAYVPRGILEGSAADVQVVDFASWLLESFNVEDYLVLKVDIEGGEHPLFKTMSERGAFKLVDEMLFECHPVPHHSCGGLTQMLKRERMRPQNLCNLHKRAADAPCGQKDSAAFWRSRRLEFKRGLLTPECKRFNIPVRLSEGPHWARSPPPAPAVVR